MKRMASVLLAFLIALCIAVGVPFSSPLLVCRLTGQSTPLPITDAAQAADACCDELPVFHAAKVAAYLLKTAPCCHTAPASERVTHAVTAPVPLSALPAVDKLIPAVPFLSAFVMPAQFNTNQTAPRGPPLRFVPSRAPPFAS